MQFKILQFNLIQHMISHIFVLGDSDEKTYCCLVKDYRKDLHKITRVFVLRETSEKQKDYRTTINLIGV